MAIPSPLTPLNLLNPLNPHAGGVSNGDTTPFEPFESGPRSGPLHFHFKKNKMVGMKILQ